MGGNGSYSAYTLYSLDVYAKDRYKTVGYIGKVKVISVKTQPNDKAPVNSFHSGMYYVTKPNNPGRITSITFYDKKTHGIKKSIDLIYDKKGNLLPFGEKGTHVHKWKLGSNGKYGRVSHDGSNCLRPTKTDWKYINKALKYNEEQSSSK